MKGIQSYQKQGVHSASNAEIVLLLFEKMIARLTAARAHMERGERTLWLTELARTRAIVVELMVSLDHQAAPALAKNLHMTYSWALNRLTEVGKTGEIEGVNQIIRVCDTLLGAFREAVCRSADDEAPAADAERATG
jgi:flagellar biosynthetic protein FliS